MKRAIAMKWIDALRSGKYRQGDACKLKDETGGYCCLGVLGELVGDCSYIGIKAKAGLKHEMGRLENSECNIDGLMVGGDLASFNDGVGAYNDGRFSFDEIADIIQLTWREL